MKTRLPVRGLMAGMLLLALGYFFPVFAADPGPPAAGEPHQVEAVTTGGETVGGALLNPFIRIKFEYGVQEINSDFIKKITFHLADNPEGEDGIELLDKNRIHGKLQTDLFQLKTDRGERSFKAVELKEIRNLKKAEGGLLQALLGLLTLAAMEIVLGIDNVIFLAIVAGKLPKEKQPRARKLGLIVALGTRLLLLLFLSVLLGLTKPIFTLPDWGILHDLEAREISLRDLILLVGGAFLIGKSTLEIHHKLEGEEEHAAGGGKTASFAKVLVQIAIIDIVFSLDSVITAVGMADELWVMIAAMVIAMLVMLAFAGKISEFVATHPTLKILALSFLILIGVMLVAEGFGQHIDKGYIYFAMAFAVLVEMINLKIGKPHPAVVLHEARMPPES